VVLKLASVSTWFGLDPAFHVRADGFPKHCFWQVAYTPEVGGDYFISVKINGIDIQGSPFTVSSDPMPREAYLDMYRSIEPEFGRKMQAEVLKAPDGNIAKKVKSWCKSLFTETK
jgi:hypothetical protein